MRTIVVLSAVACVWLVPGGAGARSPRARARAASVVHVSMFKSPSGNIGCIIILGTARCDIKHRDWRLPRRPKSCTMDVDFGQGLVVGRHGKAQIVCAGDTTFDPSEKPLPYGTDSVSGGFRCQSRITGMTCRNTRTRHGFFLSIQSYRLF
jgi:hypothetical protein